MKIKTASLGLFKPILATTLAIVIACVISVRPVQASFIVTLEQVGSNVVATGSGTIDLAGLTFSNPNNILSGIVPNSAEISTGGAGQVDVYTGALTFPTSFGGGGATLASSGSGDHVDFQGRFVSVPTGYVSGNPLSDISTYDNTTLSKLGVTPGTYKWTWGTGPHADSFTLQIGPVTAPDSGSTLGLLLVAVSGLFGVSRFRDLRLA
jgi:hypothetical protein